MTRLEPVAGPTLRTRLGEGAWWSAEDAALVFVDITGRAIHRFDPATGEHRVLPVEEDVGCVGAWPGGGFIAAFRSGLWRLDADGHTLARLAANPEGTATSRFNDGRVGPCGRFFAGTIDEARAGSARLYRYDRRGLAPLVEGLMTSNGLAFSPDGRVLYHADTPRFVVRAHAYDPVEGTIGPARPFVTMDAGGADRGRPDGAAVDRDGAYWTALYEGGRVRRHARDGTLLAEYPLAARHPTMPAFGGPDLRTLYVTTAAPAGDDGPDAGRLFAMRVDTPGLPSRPFDPDA